VEPKAFREILTCSPLLGLNMYEWKIYNNDSKAKECCIIEAIPRRRSNFVFPYKLYLNMYEWKIYNNDSKAKECCIIEAIPRRRSNFVFPYKLYL